MLISECWLKSCFFLCIPQHARRLFPTKVSTKDTVEWAYWNDSEDWNVVDKSVVESAQVSADFEKGKVIGFEGRPDPASGYYCFYNGGRLVNGEKDVYAPSSKRQE
jgi:hypothetical protein